MSKAVDKLVFPEEISYVYNPLSYAWAAHCSYLEKYGNSRKRIIFLGMNPGPWGMAQTGVPFGEISAARDWLGINTDIGHPEKEHPKRPIEGFRCGRTEISGLRLWGLMKQRFGSAENFAADHYVANYCPVSFMTETGRNFTPDKLPAAGRKELFDICDEHLRTTAAILEPEWVIGIGKFAEKRINEALSGSISEGKIKSAAILHPSPASPAANRGWSEAVLKQMKTYGLWTD